MIGILVITHGSLGESLVQCASHVLNKRPPRLKQLGFTAKDDPLLLLPQARALVKEIDDGDGVLILTDAFGWRSTMGLLTVFALVVLPLAPGLLPESRTPDRPHLDVPGAITVTGGLLSLIYALTTAAEQGFAHPSPAHQLQLHDVKLVRPTGTPWGRTGCR